VTKVLSQKAALTISVTSAVEATLEFFYSEELPWEFKGTRSSA